MREQSKAAKRRFSDGKFQTRWFQGDGVDIGAGDDGLSRQAKFFPGISSVRDWDLADGDAQYMASVPDATFDFVHSSHCLEHMVDPAVALGHWIRVVKPGGFLIVTVPDAELYERNSWPSKFNDDHKWRFTLAPFLLSDTKNLLYLPSLIYNKLTEVSLEKVELVLDFFDYADSSSDQTLTHNAECSIELVLKKHPVRLKRNILTEGKTV